MRPRGEQTNAEIKRLTGCINHLICIVALPVIWNGSDSSQIVRTFLDVLRDMLRLDFVYGCFQDTAGGPPIEMSRVLQSRSAAAGPRKVREALEASMGDDPRKWPPLARCMIENEEFSIATLPLGLRGDIGIIVAGSRRADFPAQTEKLLLNVAANQAAIGLQEAWRLSEHKRIAEELDRRVAQRTIELAAVNEELKKEIAERKLIEERLLQEERELRRSGALLAEAQQLSSTGSFSWHVATDEITWSEQTYRIFECDPAVPATIELINTRFHPEDIPLLHEMIERGRGDGGDLDYEFRLQLPDRSIKYLHLVARAHWDAGGHLEYIGAIQDVTERRRSEEALGKVRSELAHVARVTSFGTLTASIAHEVNQPLTGIITNASTCLRMLAAEPPNIEDARTVTQRTIRDGNRAAAVIARLRALFSKKPAVAEAVDMNEAAQEVIALSLRELLRNRVIVRSEFADNLPLVRGDRVQLQQVILNLILNASDAMSGVDDRLRKLVIRTRRDEGDHVRLDVQDTGIGFEPHAAERLFDPFYTTKSGGMGIGLSVSRTIIESHNGRLWAAPNAGPGAIFSFSIPRGSDDATSARAPADMRTPDAAVTDAL